jgi:hypothetical protein
MAMRPEKKTFGARKKSISHREVRKKEYFANYSVIKPFFSNC